MLASATCLNLMPLPLNEVELLTVDEAAALLRISRRKLYDLLAAGTIPKTPVGARSTRVRKAAVIQYILDREREGR